MKKLQKILFTFIFIAFISGCAMKQEINMKINKNKSMEMSYISAFDDEFIDMMIESDNDDYLNDDENVDENFDGSFGVTKEYTDEERWAFLEKSVKDGENSLFKEAGQKNLKAEKYEKDGFKGYIFTGKVENIDKITVTKESELTANDITEISDSKLFVKNKGIYKAILPIDTDDEYDTSSMPSNMGIDMKLTVTLPSKAISSNATYVSDDGKTLTWDLTKTKDDITFEFKFPVNMILISSLIVGLIIVFVIVAVTIISNKKKKDNNKINNNDNNIKDSNDLNAVSNQVNSQNISNEINNPNMFSVEPKEENISNEKTTLTQENNLETTRGQIENIFGLNQDNLIDSSVYNNNDDKQS